MAEIDPASIQTDSEVIPDLPMPLPLRINSKLYNTDAEARFQAWAQKFGIVAGDWDAAYKLSQNICLFQAAGNPKCDPTKYPAICDYTVLIAYVDDMFDSTAEVRSNEDGASTAYNTLVEIWDGMPPSGHYTFTQGAIDVATRLQLNMSPSMHHRIRNTLELYRDGVAVQNRVRKLGVMLPAHEYTMIRRAALYVNWCYVSMEWGLGLELSGEELRDNLYLEMVYLECEAVAYANDLYSFRKETLQGDVSPMSNSITLNATKHQISVQEAIDKHYTLLVALNFKLLDVYKRLDGEGYKGQMKMLIEESKHWVSTALYFQKYSPRYNIDEYMSWPSKGEGVKWTRSNAQMECVDQSAEFLETFKDFDWRHVLRGTVYDPDVPFDYKKYPDCLAYGQSTVKYTFLCTRKFLIIIPRLSKRRTIGEYEPGSLQKIILCALEKMEAAA